MRILVLVNAVTELVPTQTTAMLIRAAAERGHRVWVGGAGELALGLGGLLEVRARPLAPGACADTAGALEAVRSASDERLGLAPGDLVWVRTNPARDAGRHAVHGAVLGMLEAVQRAGVRVVNDPNGLLRAASKVYLDRFPAAYRPTSLVTRELGAIRDFVARAGGRCVIKPLQGTRGRDVFVVEGPNAPNLPALVDVVTRQGYAVVQPFVAGAEAGDVRVVVLDGAILEVGGQPAAIRRVPAAGDLRSNLHAGGRAEPAEIGAAVRQAVAAIGPVLVADGLRLVGLDFIGDQVIEANVFSTGGLRDAERFGGVDFAGAVVERLAAD